MRIGAPAAVVLEQRFPEMMNGSGYSTKSKSFPNVSSVWLSDQKQRP
jgi:hypothetical protein